MRQLYCVGLLVVLVLAGCAGPQDAGGDSTVPVEPSTQITAMQFGQKPVLDSPTALQFTVVNQQGLKNARLKIETPESVDIAGQSIWRQDLAAGEEYQFSRELTFTETDIHAITVAAGRHEDGTVAQDVRTVWVEMTESAVTIHETDPRSDNTDDSNQEDTEQDN